MQVIRPIPFVTSMLISSNAVELYPAWAAGTTYAKDAFVDYQTFIYQSLVNHNTGNIPSTSPTQWVLVGPDNTHAMFDSEVQTQTTRITPLNITVAPGQVFNSLAVMNVDAEDLTISIRDGAGGPIVYTRTIDLDDTPIIDWYMYFFEPYDFRTDVILTDLPPYPNGRIELSVSKTTGTVKVGLLTFGTVYTIGKVLQGAPVGIRDYSVKETDEFGNTTFVQRAFSKRMEPSVFMDNARLNFVFKLLSELRATPAVWIGSTNSTYSPLAMLGFYRDFNIDIAYPDYSLVRLEIEGLS